ncbi:MAG: AAA family ATPase, partial [Candidatus Moranbacteria bacterium]|nr:AAA family ATPase [Candidatus Moranbacteria bacterium]
MSTISDVESRIQAEYDFFREKDISIKIRSEKAPKDLHDSLVPYITSSEKELLFPTSGEGRKKILSYAIYNILAELNKDRRVQLFLIEEPETHIHRNMQISLSNLLFNDEKYRYLFLA